MCKRENAADALADLQAWVGEPFDAAGRRYDGGKESVDRFWKDLKTDQGMSVEPRYVELAFGCPPIEWDIDMRVRDFADRMSDEYTSLYEQDTTGIKGGDFERFGAFADNHLDFMRALTKARGMDPISSDREIGAFLNTFDKLAAMPEPSPAAQEKDDFSAGVCDPAGSMTPCAFLFGRQPAQIHARANRRPMGVAQRGDTLDAYLQTTRTGHGGCRYR